MPTIYVTLENAFMYIYISDNNKCTMLFRLLGEMRDCVHGMSTVMKASQSMTAHNIRMPQRGINRILRARFVPD